MKTQTLSDYAKIIARAYPELQRAQLQPVGQPGQFNDALLVDGRFIFRFPRYAAGVARMRREVAFLRSIRGRTTLRVPDPLYDSLSAGSPGEVFMGYALLPGEPLWRPQILAQSDEAVLDLWARQLAGFLKELHAIPVQALGGGWPVEDKTAGWQRLFHEIRLHLYPAMRPDARQAVSHHFTAYLDNAGLQRFRPTLRHGDFGSGNILHDPQTLAITGIIDFGFAGIGDPAVDVASAATLGEALFGRFAATYPAIETMLPRANFYRGTYALMEALHGFKSGDKEAYEAGIASYV